jgi:7-cyano-7-deazaguanine synthase
MNSETALVLFSGGQDSTVCLAWALERFSRVETVGFDYGQRHAIELSVRARLREKMSALNSGWAARLGNDHIIKLDALAAISDTALTRQTAIKIADSGLPTTFVPGRNLMFFCFAGALAYRRGARHLVAGMCETDYSGYPDCRDDTIKAMQVALTLGLDKRVAIHTPLMWIDKAETFALAVEIGGEAFLDLLIEDSHSCYLGDRGRHDWGYGCAHVPPANCVRGVAKFKAEVMDNERRKNVEGAIFLVLFCLTIPAANWMIGHVGTVCVANGPCLVPVAPGVMAPSGVLMVGAALVLRDLVQRRLGVEFGIGAIFAGAALSAGLVPRSLVFASAPRSLSEFAISQSTRRSRADAGGRDCAQHCRARRRLHCVLVAGVGSLNSYSARSSANYGWCCSQFHSSPGSGGVTSGLA